MYITFSCAFPLRWYVSWQLLLTVFYDSQCSNSYMHITVLFKTANLRSKKKLCRVCFFYNTICDVHVSALFDGLESTQYFGNYEMKL